MDADKASWKTDDFYFNSECLVFASTDPEVVVGTYGNGDIAGDEENRQCGRPTNKEKELRDMGKALRNDLCQRMQVNHLRRSRTGWRKDSVNHTKFI